jgi:hypothetical protein
MRLSEIKKHISFLKSLKKGSSFGIISDIEQHGIPLRKNVTGNGTFFEIPLYPPFSKYGGDLHLSVFEDSGIITKHVTFKTVIKGLQISFYYGKKYNKIDNKIDFEDYAAKAWTMPSGQPYPSDIKAALIELYTNIKPYIKIQREIGPGELSAPHTLPTWGSGSSRPKLSNEAKQDLRRFYDEYGAIPPTPVRKVLGEITNNGIKPKRLF